MSLSSRAVYRAVLRFSAYQPDIRLADLVPVIRVLGLTSIVVSGVRRAAGLYRKDDAVRRFFFSALGGTLFSAVVGITMAYRGFGIWALVAQQLLNAAVSHRSSG